MSDTYIGKEEKDEDDEDDATADFDCDDIGDSNGVLFYYYSTFILKHTEAILKPY